MKNKLFLLSFFLFSMTGFSQTDKQNMNVVISSEPSYPGGDNTLYTYVMYNLKYPDAAIKKYVTGEVTLSFDVKADSTVTNVIIISGVGYGVDEEVKKLVQSLKFIPGVQNGVVVKMNTMYTFPVKAH